MCRGREKKGTSGEYRLKWKSLEYTPSGSSTRGRHRVFGSARIDNILSLNFRSRIEQSQS